MAVKKKAIIIPAVVAVLAGGGLYACNVMTKAANESMMANSKYTVIPAGQNDLSKVISTTGKVIGNGTVDVTTKLNCSVSKVNVSLGDMVKEGDLLCEFDSTELQEEYDGKENRKNKIPSVLFICSSKTGKAVVNTEPLPAGKACESLAVTFLSSSQCVILFYVHFCLKTPC